MAELPSGTVTFLFTDIEGSTRLLKQLGDRYGEVLAEHQRILRDAAESRGGREIDTQGDSFFFAFARANDALAAAVVAQRELAAHDWPEEGRVRVRMGLHTGEPSVGEDRYVGMGVHRAARIGAVAHGGQVLLSSATRELVEDQVGGVSVSELGVYRLKDIDRPERLFQLDIDGLRTEFPPLKAEKVAAPHPLRRRALLLSATAGVIAAAVAIPIFAFGQSGGGEESIRSAAGNSVGFVDPESNKLVADVQVGTTPTDVAVGEGAVWVTNSADDSVDRIDPTTHTVRQTIHVGHGPDGIAVGEGSVWVANGLDGSVSRIDPLSNQVTQKIDVGNGPGGIAVGRGKVWVVNQDDRTLSRIDPVAGTVAGVFDVGSGPVDVAVGAAGVWVTSETDGKVLRLDPSTGSILDSVPVGRGSGAIAVMPNGIWIANEVDGTVSRVDPSTATTSATIPVGKAPTGVAAVSGAVWVASSQDGVLTRIDPATNRVAKRVSIGSSPAGVAAGPGGVFVAVRPAAGAHRGGTVTMVNQGWYSPGTLDPAVTIAPVLNMTNDGLTAFKRVGGREGTELVPDLAASLPEPTDAGRTYTFRLRKGIRYSGGRPVVAGDFRRAIERNFQLKGDYTWLWAAIVGAETCSNSPKGCDLSRGIVANHRAGTITFHLTEPDPDFLFKLALPPAFAVPQDTPSRDVRGHPLPATGPYRIAAFAPRRQIRLVRNPRFREWSRAARPDGYPDVILIKFDTPVPTQVRSVGAGRADVAELSNSGEADLRALRARYGARLHSVPTSVGVYTLLNTRLKPFDDVRVRRALSYALDREAIVRTAGGPLYSSASCQVLPANFPGYRPYCTHGGDLAEARRLVAASGTRGTPVVVWTRTSYAKFYAHVVTALRKLGYPARLKAIDDTVYLDAVQKAGPGKIQASYIGWVTDYPSAGNYITSLLSYVEPATGFSDRAVKGQIRRAQRLQQTDLAAADELWGRIDRMITDQAAVMPMYNLRGVSLVSERVGNFQYHPLWFTLLDQLWVR